jgi:hypothetical protein
MKKEKREYNADRGVIDVGRGEGGKEMKLLLSVPSLIPRSLSPPPHPLSLP